jgi:thiol-disulfide isomerase/thioredoxin
MLIFCVSIASIWFSIKPILEIANDVKLTNAKMLLLKSNINVFMALLRRQRTIDASLWENDFLIGSKDAAVQLMVAINTYCPPCAREYKNLLEIVRTFPDSIGVTMRFFVDSNEDSKTTRSVLYVLSQYVSTSKEEQSKILENWFSSNPVSPEEKKVHQYTEQTGILKQYQEWFHKNNVTHTPTIFLNGYELPKPYYVLDLKMLIPKLSNRLIKLTNQKVNNGSPQDSSLKHS